MELTHKMSSKSVYCHSSTFFYCTKHSNHWMRVLVFSGLLQFARSLDFSSITDLGDRRGGLGYDRPVTFSGNREWVDRR